MLRRVFVAHGLAEHLVSDNGPQFTSTEFQEFHVSSPHLHIILTSSVGRLTDLLCL